MKYFKKFLKKRMEYIQEKIKFNVYPCETSEEALELVKRKKYNKIILISNAGTDLTGRQFIIINRIWRKITISPYNTKFVSFQ